MAKRGYAIAFLIVLLAAGAAAFFGGRALLRSFEGGALSGGWVPPDQRTATPAGAPVAAVVVPPTGKAAAAPPADFTPDLSRVTIVPFASPTPTATAPVVPTVRTRTVAVSETATAASSPTPVPPSTEYVTAGPVRYSTGDCPGNYILGRVTGPNGNPLPDVRLLLVDEYGNAEAKVSKAGANEAGQYDFPLFGAHRRFYLSIADAGGNPLSPVVEIDYGVGANPQATCHHLDWRRQ